MKNRLPSTARRVVAVLAVGLVLVAGTTGCRRESKNKVVVLVHGWSATGGTDCGSTFDGMITQLRSEGFTGSIVKVGFYTGDTNCDVSLRDWGSFDNSSSWKELAKAFSHYVYDEYTSQGTTIDAVGYSMGGLVVRGGVYGSTLGEGGFSAPIKVEDALTLGAPHNGSSVAAFCLWGQCASMKPGASEITWVNQDGNPQGLNGTEWTVVGSEADTVTLVDSGLYMTLPPERVVRYTDVPHTGADNYMGRADVVTRSALALEKANA